MCGRVGVFFEVANDPTELGKEKHFIIFTLLLGMKEKLKLKIGEKRLIFF